MNQLDDLLTVSALAAAYKRDRRTVNQLLRDIPPASEAMMGKRTTKRYRRGDVEAILTAPTAANALANAFEDLHAARAELRRAKRRLRHGELIENGTVSAALGERLGNLRTALLGLCDRYGPQLVGALKGANRATARRRVDKILAEAADEALGDLLAPFSWESTK